MAHKPKVAGSNPAPATTEINRLGQPQAVEHFSPLRGAGCAIAASSPVLYRHHSDRLEDLSEDAIGARRCSRHWAHAKRADGRAVGQRSQSCLEGVTPPLSILQQRRGRLPDHALDHHAFNVPQFGLSRPAWRSSSAPPPRPKLRTVPSAWASAPTVIEGWGSGCAPPRRRGTRLGGRASTASASAPIQSNTRTTGGRARSSGSDRARGSFLTGQPERRRREGDTEAAMDQARRVIEPWQIAESTWLLRAGFMDVRRDRCRKPDGEPGAGLLRARPQGLLRGGRGHAAARRMLVVAWLRGRDRRFEGAGHPRRSGHETPAGRGFRTDRPPPMVDARQ
jgi:hypothetical protein